MPLVGSAESKRIVLLALYFLLATTSAFVRQNSAFYRKHGVARAEAGEQQLSSFGGRREFSATTAALITGAGFVQGAQAATPFSGRQSAPSSSGSRVNKDADSLLRNGLPIKNDAVRLLQSLIEAALSDITVRRTGQASDGLGKAKDVVRKRAGDILASIDKARGAEGTKRLASIDELCTKALAALGENAAQGSIQERGSLDRAIAAVKLASRDVSGLEELMVPDFKPTIPAEYQGFPVLTVRPRLVPRRDHVSKRGPLTFR